MEACHVQGTTRTPVQRKYNVQEDVEPKRILLNVRSKGRGPDWCHHRQGSGTYKVLREKGFRPRILSIKPFQTYKNSELPPIKQCFLGYLRGNLLQWGEEEKRKIGGCPDRKTMKGNESRASSWESNGVKLEQVWEMCWVVWISAGAPSNAFSTILLKETWSSFRFTFPLSWKSFNRSPGFTIKSNLHCDIKGPLLLTSALLAPLWMATRSLCSNHWSFYRFLKAICHRGASVAAVLSHQGNPPSPPFSGRFFLVSQTSLSWGNFPWLPLVLFSTHHWFNSP